MLSNAFECLNGLGENKSFRLPVTGFWVIDAPRGTQSIDPSRPIENKISLSRLECIMDYPKLMQRLSALGIELHNAFCAFCASHLPKMPVSSGHLGVSGSIWEYLGVSGNA